MSVYDLERSKDGRNWTVHFSSEDFDTTMEKYYGLGGIFNENGWWRMSIFYRDVPNFYADLAWPHQEVE